jgi:PAS domain S-box-containing protein
MVDSTVLKQLLVTCGGFAEFQSVLDNFDLPVCIKDVTDSDNKIIMFANKAFLRMSKYKLSEIIGKTADELMCADWHDKISNCPLNPDMTFRELNCSMCERYVMFTKDGTLLHHELTTEEIEYQGRLYSVSVHKDATTQQLITINDTLSNVRQEFQEFRRAMDILFKPFEERAKMKSSS